MPIVEVNGQEIEFPDSMSQDAIKEVLRQKFPQPQQFPTPGPQEGWSRTALEQGLQGATFGFADELTNRLGALGASAVTGEDYGDLLQEAQEQSKMRMDRQYEQRPMTSIVSNIGGGLLTGAAATVPKIIIGSAATGGARGALNVIPKAGAAISSGIGRGILPQATGKLGRAANLASKGAGYGAAGATSAGLYGAGTAEEGGRMQGATEGAAMGGAVGAALPFAGAGLSKINYALGFKSPIPNADKLREQSSALYKLADSKGGVLKPEITNSFVDAVESFKPQTEVGKLVGGDSPFTKAVERISSIRNKPISLQAAQEVDEILGDTIDDFVDAKTGKLTKQGKKLFDIQSAFRNAISEADESMIIGGKEGFDALKKGRELWATSRRLADIERIIANADSYQVPATAIKTGFRTLARNPNRMRGYSAEERKAIERAARTGIVTDALNVFGSRLGPLMAAIGGTTAGGPLGGLAASAGTYAASGLARKGASALQGKRAKEALEAVALRGQKRGVKPLTQISAEKLKQIMKMSPRDAEKALKELK